MYTADPQTRFEGDGHKLSFPFPSWNEISLGTESLSKWICPDGKK